MGLTFFKDHLQIVHIYYSVDFHIFKCIIIARDQVLGFIPETYAKYFLSFFIQRFKFLKMTYNFFLRSHVKGLVFNMRMFSAAV